MEMEQDVDVGYRPICSTCLSSDRDLVTISGLSQIYEIFRLLMYDFAGDPLGESLAEMEQLLCWECLALMKRFVRFKKQVHSAQEHLRVLAMSRSQESLDHTYISQSLSSLESVKKVTFDKIYVDCMDVDWGSQTLIVAGERNVKDENYDVAQVVRDNISLEVDQHLLGVPAEMILDSSMMSHIVVQSEGMVSTSDFFSSPVKGELTELKVSTLSNSDIGDTDMGDTDIETFVIEKRRPQVKEEVVGGLTYFTEYMSEEDMLAHRESAKKKIQYSSAAYKCELCVIGFLSQHQVEEHYVSAHREKEGYSPCRICYVYVEDPKLGTHVNSHYIKHTCKMCGHYELSSKLINLHAKCHAVRQLPDSVIKIGLPKQGRKKKSKEAVTQDPPKPGDLRKLLSKTVITGYKCLECDMFFKNSRARKNHVDRYHREGLQCDHCKKKFVNKTTLATHLKLHEGPLPREECPVCHKMVRKVQLKYHIQRHQNKSKYKCIECNKVFSHLATYQAHLKYARAHATEQVLKFPCPMCNKGYPTKEAMQDHFNYQHLGKTSHKCPICEKPIASRANVEKHMMRVHKEKKQKPRTHVCQVCRKGFTDKKALTQHEVIHSGERPLSCDMCEQTFKQKASLYTHRKRVHKLFPPKRVVQYMETKHNSTI